MDLVQVFTSIIAGLALAWAGYERFIQSRNLNGEYIKNLADALTDLRTFYDEQVLDLKEQVKQLRTRVASLEAMVNNIGCLKTDCPIRIAPTASWSRKSDIK